MSNTGVSARLAHCHTWMRDILRRGTMKLGDVHQLAHVLSVKPDQLRAAKPGKQKKV